MNTPTPAAVLAALDKGTRGLPHRQHVVVAAGDLQTVIAVAHQAAAITRPEAGRVLIDRDLAIAVDSELSAIGHGRPPQLADCNRLAAAVRQAYAEARDHAEPV